MDIKESNGNIYVIEVNDNPSLEGGEDAHYPDMFGKIISYLMTGDAGCYAESLSQNAMGYKGIGDLILGSDAAMCSPSAMAENETYSYKIDFSER